MCAYLYLWVQVALPQCALVINVVHSLHSGLHQQETSLVRTRRQLVHHVYDLPGSINDSNPEGDCESVNIVSCVAVPSLYSCLHPSFSNKQESQGI